MLTESVNAHNSAYT